MQNTGPGYFQDASVEYEGRTVHFTAEEGRAMKGSTNYWHGPANPSTWLAVATYWAAREKLKDAPEAVALELAAGVLGITVNDLRSSIEWNEQYMRWHDGDPDYRILEE